MTIDQMRTKRENLISERAKMMAGLNAINGAIQILDEMIEDELKPPKTPEEVKKEMQAESIVPKSNKKKGAK